MYAPIMFSGLVKDVGTVENATHKSGGTELVVCTSLSQQLELGASIAVNGVCLTVTYADAARLKMTVVPETLARTTLSQLAKGSHVNLEPALRMGEPLGGHLVQGHVDGVGSVRRVEELDAVEMVFDVEASLRRYIVEKGSIAIDGVSLTVASIDNEGFRVALVPHTLTHTTLSRLRAGSHVNLEVDLIAKYVERLLIGHTSIRSTVHHKTSSGVTWQFLKEQGYV